MTENLMPSIEDQIEGFRALVDADDKASKEFTTDTKARRASMLAKAYTLSLDWLAMEDKKELAHALHKRQIPVPDESAGENPYRPFIRLLFGHYDHDAEKVGYGAMKGLTKFVRNSSAERYAGVLRHLADHDVPQNEAEQFIVNFDGHLDGIIAADRKAHTKKPVINDGELTERLGHITPLGEITLPLWGSVTTEQFGAAWFVRNGSKLVIYGILPKTADRAKAAAIAAGEAAQSAHAADAELSKSAARFMEVSIKAKKLKKVPLAA